jgi:hypothetical protein
MSESRRGDLGAMSRVSTPRDVEKEERKGTTKLSTQLL